MTATEQAPTLTMLYMYRISGTECLSHTPGSHLVCTARIPLGVDRKILAISKEFMLSGFLTLNAHSILPHARNERNLDVMRWKQGKVKKAGSWQESKPGHLWLELPVLWHWATATRQPPTVTILFMYRTSGTECFSFKPGSHSVCAVSTYRGFWGLVVVRLPYLSGRALAAQARGVLCSTPAGCQPFI